MMGESEFELDHYPMFQLGRSYESLALLNFFVTGTGYEPEGLNDEPLMELRKLS